MRCDLDTTHDRADREGKPGARHAAAPGSGSTATPARQRSWLWVRMMSRTTLLWSLAALALLGAACTAADDAAASGPPDFDAAAEGLIAEFEAVPAGSYLVETLGTPFSLTVDEDWFVQVNSEAGLVLTDPASSGPGDRDVVFMRPTDLSDPAAPSARVWQQELWPVDDLQGWLDRVAGGVLVGDVRERSLGGTQALAFDLELAEDVECGMAFCALFVDVDGRNGLPLFRDVEYRVWWLDQGPYAPIAVVVGASSSEAAFFDRAEELLTTVAFGPPAPHPFEETGQS